MTNKLPRLLLTAAVPASPEAIAAGYDVPEVVKYVDFLNVMTYDFHGHWEGQVGHNSPLFPLETAASHQRKLTVVRFDSILFFLSITCSVPFRFDLNGTGFALLSLFLPFDVCVFCVDV